MGVLAPDDAVALMFEVAGTRTVPPYDQIAYRAAEACGRLPLAVAIAGGILPLDLGTVRPPCRFSVSVSRF